MKQFDLRMNNEKKAHPFGLACEEKSECESGAANEEYQKSNKLVQKSKERCWKE